MSAEFVADPQGSFEVDAGADGPGAQLAVGEGFRRRIDREPAGAEFHRGEAAARTSYRGAKCDGWVSQERGRRVDDEAHIMPLRDRIDRSHMAEGGYDAGEHARCLVYSLTMSSPTTFSQSLRNRGM